MSMKGMTREGMGETEFLQRIELPWQKERLRFKGS